MPHLACTHHHRHKHIAGLSLRSAPHSPSNALPPGPTRAPSSSLTYGAHTAVGMALGFLFLGQGRLTFGTRPLAVASLLCAVLPPFPLSSQDQRASHQVSEGFGGEEGVGCLLGHRVWTVRRKAGGHDARARSTLLVPPAR